MGGAPADGGTGAGLVRGFSVPLDLIGEPTGLTSASTPGCVMELEPVSSPVRFPFFRLSSPALARLMGGVSLLLRSVISAASSRISSGCVRRLSTGGAGGRADLLPPCRGLPPAPPPWTSPGGSRTSAGESDGFLLRRLRFCLDLAGEGGVSAEGGVVAGAEATGGKEVSYYDTPRRPLTP